MLRSPWGLGALPSKAPPLFWGRTELYPSGGVFPSKRWWPGHCSQINLLCSQTPVVGKAMFPRSPATPASPGLRQGWPTSCIHVCASLSLPFPLSDLSLSDCPGPGTVCNTPSRTCNTPSGTVAFSNLYLHHKLEVFWLLFCLFIFTKRKAQRNQISLQQDVFFHVIVLIGASRG